MLVISALLIALSGITALLVSQVSAYTAPVILGELPYQKLLSYPLGGDTTLEVNAANGNLVLKTQEMNVSGTTLPLTVTRYFNNLGSAGGPLGSRTTMSVGPDVHITANPDGSATYQGPSGFQVTYPSDGSGGYTVPATYTAAKLMPVSGGGWTLTYNASREVYTFDAAGNQTKDTSASGESITYGYTGSTLSSATDTQGRSITFSPRTGHPTLIDEIRDSTSRQTGHTYNSAGQLTEYDDPALNNWHYTYDASGNLATVQDGNTITTQLAYDSSGRVTGITFDSTHSSTATTWNFTYNSGNTVVTDPLTHSTTYNYDVAGRATGIVDADGNNHGSTWDANNNRTSSTSPTSATTSFVYDALSNLTSVTNPNLPSGGSGAQTSYAYGGTSNPYLPSTKTDAQGNQTAFSYGVYGNVKQATNTSGSGSAMGSTLQTRQGDSATGGGTVNCGAQNGEICTATDANGNVTSYGYDANGNLVSVTTPSPRGAVTISYDGISRPHTYTDGNGVTSTIIYNDADRPLEVKTSTTDTVYDYDNNYNLVSITENGVTTEYDYDHYNRITTVSGPGYSISYTYDKVGNLTIEDNDTHTTYAYDAANYLTSIKNDAANTTQTFSYTNGQLISATLPGGITETFGYDQDGRQTSVKAVKGSTTIEDLSGTYTTSSGADSNLLQSQTDHVTGKTTTYSYDGMNRLTAAAQSGTGANSFTYTYDSNGNLTGSTHNGVAGPTFGYNAANQLTTVNGSSSGAYDGAGNQTLTRNGLALGYDANNQTTSFTPSGGSAIAATYVSNNQNERTKMGTTTERNGLLGLYSDKTGTNLTDYIHMPIGSKQMVAEVINFTPYFYITDLQGSVVAVTNTSGVVKDTYQYDPYGNLLSSTGTIANAIRYDSGYYDSSTALYKFGARYYNTTDARWTQLDPSGQNPGYIFANDDPVNEVDPSGTSFLSSAFNAVEGVADIAGGAIDGATVGGTVGGTAGCLGGALVAGPGGCIVGGIEGAEEGSIALGVANGVYNAVTGNDPFAM